MPDHSLTKCQNLNNTVRKILLFYNNYRKVRQIMKGELKIEITYIGVFKIWKFSNYDSLKSVHLCNIIVINTGIFLARNVDPQAIQ